MLNLNTDPVVEIVHTLGLDEIGSERAELITGIQECFDAIICNPDDATLTISDRVAIARAAAEASGSAYLFDWYKRVSAPGATGLTVAQATCAQWYACTASADPLVSHDESVRRLRDVSLTDQQIMVVGQIVGFVSYQVRVISGLLAMKEAA